MMNTATALPIEELEVKLGEWAWEAGEGHTETNGLELLDIDEDEAVARYGEAAAEILCATITASLEYHCTYRQTWDCPEEGWCFGNVWMDREGTRDASFEGEDGLVDSTTDWWTVR